jgi:hypothetical protein
LWLLIQVRSNASLLTDLIAKLLQRTLAVKDLREGVLAWCR